MSACRWMNCTFLKALLVISDFFIIILLEFSNVSDMFFFYYILEPLCNDFRCLCTFGVH